MDRAHLRSAPLRAPIPELATTARASTSRAAETFAHR